MPLTCKVRAASFGERYWKGDWNEDMVWAVT